MKYLILLKRSDQHTDMRTHCAQARVQVHSQLTTFKVSTSIVVTDYATAAQRHFKALPFMFCLTNDDRNQYLAHL